MRWLFFGVVGCTLACGARTQLPVDGDDGGTGGRVGSGGSGPGSGGSGAGGGAGGQGVGGVEQMALGASHTCLRTHEGDVYCWGSNTQGQLGVGEGVDEALLPERVPLDAPATYLAAGTYHTCATLLDDRTFCWGKNLSGQVGVGSDAPKIFEPTELGLAAVPIQLALGEAHSCGLFRDGQAEPALYCWGSGSDGQTGQFASSSTPAFVQPGVTAVTAGAFHTCFLDAVGGPSCMGSNADGQLGDPAAGASAIDVLPVGLPDAPMQVLASGRGFHTCGISDGRLYCWGDNDEGQLGLGFLSANEIVESPLGVPEGVPATAVAPGFAHTAAIFGGDVYTWGDNYSGQLGTSGGDALVPTRVPSLSNVVAIGTGTVHSCAYVSPTEIYCWGSNDFGQLGDGTKNPSPVPVKVVLPP
jgi:alpha-tubulin suppressor-like RCC1 family protein